MSDIFISYASEDIARIKPLVDALHQRGWTVWWDRTILAGKVWEREIEAALAASRCVIVAWSQASVQSDWVWTEADEGKRRSVLVPVLLDLVTIPLAFRKIQAANLVDWRGETPNAQFEEVARAITALLGSGAPPAVAAATAGIGATQSADHNKTTLSDLPDPAKPPNASTAAQASGQPPAHEVRAADATLAKEKTSSGIPSSTLAFGARRTLILGALGFAGVIGLVWYFASRPQNTLPPAAPSVASPEATATATVSAPGTVRLNSKDGRNYVWLPVGSFTMGCSPGDSECWDDEKPAHAVTISKGFWLGQTAVTVEAWRRYRLDKNKPELPTGDIFGRKLNEAASGKNLPAVSMTWEEAGAFCEWAGGRLPTEAEWEYAARAGSTADPYGDLDSIAWYGDNSGKQRIDSAEIWRTDQTNYDKRLYQNGNGPHPVAEKKPNGWKLYDMLGNVWQWTSDWYGEKYYAEKEGSDPQGPASGTLRTLRGGSWSTVHDVRVSLRDWNEPGNRRSNVGVRCVGEKFP